MRLWVLTTVAALLGSTAPASAGPETDGRWSGLTGLPLVASSGALLSNGKVLLWAADGEFGFNTSGQVWSALYDPATNAISPKRLFGGGHNMFCTGTTNLADGRILANGGSQTRATTVYDPATDTIRHAQDMNVERGYNSNTLLSDGSVLTFGGSWSGAAGDRIGEIWTEASGWRTLPGLTTTPVRIASQNPDSHMWLLPSGSGKVLYAGPHPSMQWLDTRGGGSITAAGPRGDDSPAMSGIAVMYDTGSILKAGGGRDYGGEANASAYAINIRTGVSVAKLSPMTYPRMYHNSVVLPDGKVIVIGGQTYGVGFSDSNAVLPAEMWDPATGRFSLLPPIAVARNYHSIALLLPDARVLSAGGGLCGGGCAANHADLQIYTPGYLLDGAGNPRTRPTITNAPDQLTYGRAATVTTDRDVVAFSLVRTGSTTHTVNNDQRRLSLTHRRTGTNVYEVDVPSNPGWLLPGTWMLFALDANGTPSVARMVSVGVNGVVRMVAPDAVVGGVGTSLSVQPSIVKIASNVTFGGANLPPGLQVDPATGRLYGTPTITGTWLVGVTATAGTDVVSTEFTVAIDLAPGNGTGLRADYFANKDLKGPPALTRTEAVNFGFGTAGPGGGLPGSNFSVRWTGSILADRTGATRLIVTSDDGVRVWVGGNLVIDLWNDHGPTDRETSLQMVAGQTYPVMIEYYNGNGNGDARLYWQRVGDAAPSPVPTSQLFVPTTYPTTNVAIRKPATQSSDFNATWLAAVAVDGNSNGVIGSNSVSHTNIQAQPWWQVDLGVRHDIDRVVLWNRTDCCGDRLQNFMVFLADTDMAGRSYDQLVADPTVKRRRVGGTAIPSSIGIQVLDRARFVRIQLAGSNYLQLAEVEVYGTPSVQPPVVTAMSGQSATVGAAARVQVSASDPNGSPLVYKAQGLPPGLVIASDTGLITGFPTTAGSYPVTVNVTNAANLSAATTFMWTVSPPLPLPSVTALAVKPATSKTAVTYQPTIANGSGATFSWSWGDGTPDTTWSSGSAGTHTYVTPGVYLVTLGMRAADGRQTAYRFTQAVYAATSGTARAAVASGLAYESRASASPRLWVANPDTDTVGVLDLGTNTLAAEIPVGKRPVSVAIRPNGEVWSINRDAATASVMDPVTLKVIRTVALPRASRPGSIVFAGSNALITLEAIGQICVIWGDANWGGSVDVGTSPRFVTLSPAGDYVVVPRFVTPPLPGEATAKVSTVDASGNPVGGEVLQIDLTGKILRTVVLQHSEKPDSEVSARGIPNYLGPATFSPDGQSVWIPSKQDNIKRGRLRDGQDLDFQTTVRAIVSRIDLTTGLEDLASRVDLDNSGLASAIAFHPTGAWMFVALQTSREVAVVDPVGRRELFRFGAGRAPSDLAISPDGNLLYVSNFMDRTVSVVDLAPFTAGGRLDVAKLADVPTIRTEKLTSQVLRGKQFFYDAADRRLARDGYLSCAACHDNAEHDGRVWDFTGFGEGLRNTISLAGHGGTAQGFLHWTANFDEIQDFEGQIRSFAQGTGLMSNADFAAGTRSQQLGDKKAGLSADLDALAAYLASRNVFPLSPWRNADGSLTSPATSGLAAFTRLGCNACHTGAGFTISGDATRLKSIGTIKPSSGKRLGGPLIGLDVPTLLGLASTAPYLHNGSAPTIEAAIAAHTNVLMTATDRANLAAYLKQLDGETMTLKAGAPTSLSMPGIGKPN